MSAAGPGPSLWNRHEASLLAVLSVIVVTGSVVGGAAFFKTGEATNHGSARCYTVLSVGSGTSFMGTTIVAPGQVGSPEQVQSAMAGCASLWRQGFLTAGSTINKHGEYARKHNPAADFTDVPPADNGPGLEEAWQTMAGLQKEGKVRWIGVSNFTVAQIERAEKIALVISLQLASSCIRRWHQVC